MSSSNKDNSIITPDVNLGKLDVPYLTFFKSLKIRRSITRNAFEGFKLLSSETKEILKIKLSGRHAYFVKKPEFIQYFISNEHTLFRRLVLNDITKLLRVQEVNETGAGLEMTQQIPYLPTDFSSSINIIDEELNALITEHLGQRPVVEKINIETELQRLLLRITCRTLIAPQLEVNAESLQESINDILEFNRFQSYLNFIRQNHNTLNNSVFFLQIPAYLRDALNYLNEISEHLSTDLLNKVSDNGLAFNNLITAYRNKLISFQQLLDELKITFVVNSIPIAETLTLALYSIYLTPGLRRKLEHEISAIDKIPSDPSSLFSTLPLTRSVIFETLRLYPPFWLIQRFNDRSVSFDQYYIPDNSWVIVSPFTIHRDPAFWNDPEKFIPDRFLDIDIDKLGRDKFLPLGIDFDSDTRLQLFSFLSVYILAFLIKNVKLQFYKNMLPLLDPTSILKCQGIVMAKVEKHH